MSGPAERQAPELDSPQWPVHVAPSGFGQRETAEWRALEIAFGPGFGTSRLAPIARDIVVGETAKVAQSAGDTPVLLALCREPFTRDAA